MGLIPVGRDETGGADDPARLPVRHREDVRIQEGKWFPIQEDGEIPVS